MYVSIGCILIGLRDDVERTSLSRPAGADSLFYILSVRTMGNSMTLHGS